MNKAVTPAGLSRRALAKLLSDLERGEPAAVVRALSVPDWHESQHSIGITGAPGSGKSTLVDKLAAEFSVRGKSVAVLAVDPSSSLTGGAVLGDRVRMSGAFLAHNVFIRSFASRGALGGIHLTTKLAQMLLLSEGYEIVLVETVGVGQSEIDIATIADTTVLVLTPGCGDWIQAAKAGIWECADIFVCNKADQPGINLLEQQVKEMLALVGKPREQQPPVIRTTASKGSGLQLLADAMGDQFSLRVEGGEIGSRRLRYRNSVWNDFLEYDIQQALRAYKAQFPISKYTSLHLGEGVQPQPDILLQKRRESAVRSFAQYLLTASPSLPKSA